MPYPKPSFLPINQKTYQKWLNRRAISIRQRDIRYCKKQPRRCLKIKLIAGYRDAIHQAVVDCRGLDAYTGEKLDWHLIGTYDNQKIHSLPTVDHVKTTALDIKIT